MAYYGIGTVAFLPNIKRLERETDYYFRKGRDFVELYIHSPICLHGLVFN